MTNKFKAGDVVVCVDAGSNALIKTGQEYVVENPDCSTFAQGFYLSLKGSVGQEYRHTRFELKQSTKHIHFDLITAWANNPKLVIEYFSKLSKEWHVVCGSPNWDETTKYRIQPEPERVFPETSLSVLDLRDAYDGVDGFSEAMTAVANAAIKQYILDCEKVVK